MRLTKKDLMYVVNTTITLTGLQIVVGHWNGFYHVYYKENNEQIVVGTLREVYDYILAFNHGIKTINSLEYRKDDFK